jgi:hypothetical protein
LPFAGAASNGTFLVDSSRWRASRRQQSAGRNPSGPRVPGEAIPTPLEAPVRRVAPSAEEIDEVVIDYGSFAPDSAFGKG